MSVVDVVDVVSVHDGSMLASHVLLESVVDVVDVVVVIIDSEGFDVPELVEVPLSLGGVASAVDGDDRLAEPPRYVPGLHADWSYAALDGSQGSCESPGVGPASGARWTERAFATVACTWCVLVLLLTMKTATARHMTSSEKINRRLRRSRA